MYAERIKRVDIETIRGGGGMMGGKLIAQALREMYLGEE